MIYSMGRLSWALTLAIATLTLPLCAAAMEGYEPSRLKKDVRDSELVVQGMIVRVHSEMMAYDDLFEDKRPNQEYPVTIIEVEIRTVIKGKWEGETVKASLPGDPKFGGYSMHTTYDYEPGEEVILCLHYDPKIVGDRFRLYGDAGSFVRRGETWLTRGESALVSVPDIRALAQSVEPKSMVNNADAVILGTIEELDTREFDCGFPKPCIADYATLRVDRVWKGASVGETILVRALRRGTNLHWYAPVPPLAVGESYLMFLKKDDIGFFPFVGYNGFLKAQGEKLIMNGYIEYPVPKSRMIAIVQDEVAD